MLPIRNAERRSKKLLNQTPSSGWEGDLHLRWGRCRPPGPGARQRRSEQALAHDFTASAPSLQARICKAQASNLRLALAERRRARVF